MTIALTPKTIVAISAGMLLLSAVFGILNSFKVQHLQSDLSNVTALHQASETKLASEQKKIKVREALAAEAVSKAAESEAKAAKAEADLLQAQKDKAEIQTKLETNEAEIVSLQKSIQEATGKPAGEIPGTPSINEVDAQIDELRHSLESAESEKLMLSDKLRVAEQKVTQMEDEKKRRVAASGRPGVRGTILAVNQAYNFVVLNLGGRQGVETNSEMLVLREGTMIAKIRISSVEPATAIGDIITTSLARGVQVQPGDIVIYAGTSS